MNNISYWFIYMRYKLSADSDFDIQIFWFIYINRQSCIKNWSHQLQPVYVKPVFSNNNNNNTCLYSVSKLVVLNWFFFPHRKHYLWVKHSFFVALVCWNETSLLPVNDSNLVADSAFPFKGQVKVKVFHSTKQLHLIQSSPQVQKKICVDVLSDINIPSS